MTFISALILFGIIIFVHELGHFLFAKIMGVRVLKFSLGFGPKLIGKKYGDTEYLISAVPLGGYVKMLGETSEEQLGDEEKQFAYNYQKVWKRLVIVVAGPLFNIIFAVAIFFFSFLNGLPVMIPEIGGTMPDTPAAKAGLLKADRIMEIDGIVINQWEEMTEVIHKNPGKPLSMTIQRDGKSFKVTLTPEKKRVKDIFGEGKDIGLIGIKPSGNTIIKKENIPNAFAASIDRTWEMSALTLVSIVKLIQRVIPIETMGGPILIVQMAGEQASRGVLNFFIFMAIININLGVLNLLPVPILDGGHVLFLSIEAIRKKPLSEKVVSISQKIGLAILLTLMVVVFYNDILRLITGKQFP
jgi:regulator of sigma E protease